MAGKYLSQNCLCVEDNLAVEKVYTLLNQNTSPDMPKSDFNKNSYERTSFLSRIKKNIR